MFQGLTDRLELAIKSLKGERTLTELNIAESIKEIRRALVGADVNYKIAKEFTDKVKEKALGTENVLKSVKPGDLMVKIVRDELTDLMGGNVSSFKIEGKPAIVLISGLQGSGKTTFSAKLANYLSKKSPLLVACDVYRPAAIDQLTSLAEKIKVPIYKNPEEKNPVKIAQEAISYAKSHGNDVVIIDTAGRLSVDDAMMKEIKELKQKIQPTETLFVVDSMTGQDAVNTAKAFNEVIDFDGVVLTKLDGDTRGGAALSIKYTVGKPIKFVSTGEKMETIDVFYPERMAQRILGMGDIISFVEKAQSQFDAQEAKRLESKIKKNKFDFNDFLGQINQIKKMGDLKNLMGMIPGINKMTKDIDVDNSAFSKVEAIIYSMTPQERANPDLLTISRKTRIAKGCGQSMTEINQFIKQFDTMRKMMHKVSKNPSMLGNLQNAMGAGSLAKRRR